MLGNKGLFLGAGGGREPFSFINNRHTEAWPGLRTTHRQKGRKKYILKQKKYVMFSLFIF